MTLEEQLGIFRAVDALVETEEDYRHPMVGGKSVRATDPKARHFTFKDAFEHVTNDPGFYGDNTYEMMKYYKRHVLLQNNNLGLFMTCKRSMQHTIKHFETLIKEGK